MKKLIGPPAFVVAVCILSLALSFAGDEKPAPSEAAQIEMMEKYQQLSTPGEQHKLLENFVGQWKSSLKFWISPQAPPQESQGSSENRWIMDKRFVQQDFKGEAMGQPFQGMGILGYDNVRKEFTSIWLDNMGTGIMTATAQYDPAAKTFTEKGSFACPMTGQKNKTFRGVWKVVDKDHNIYEMHTKDQDGKEFKSMVISYERVK